MRYSKSFDLASMILKPQVSSFPFLGTRRQLFHSSRRLEGLEIGLGHLDYTDGVKICTELFNISRKSCVIRILENSQFFKKDVISLFLDRREGGEKERERSISVWLLLTRPPLGTYTETQACALTGNQTHDPLVCRLALNPLSHTSQGRTLTF